MQDPLGCYIPGAPTSQSRYPRPREDFLCKMNELKKCTRGLARWWLRNLIFGRCRETLKADLAAAPFAKRYGYAPFYRHE